MAFKRFVGNTSKEAMTQVRRALGDGAVILSNKRLPNGQIEILAAASDAVDAIVEDARRPQPIAARKGPPPVETFQDYLRRQGQATPPPAARPQPRQATPAASAYGASMYGEVAAATHDEPALDLDLDDTGWANSRFDPSLTSTGPRTGAPRAAQSTRGATAATGARAAAPTWDTHLPSDARAPRARPATINVPLPEPAVFRRRPSRESVVIEAAAMPPDASIAPATQPAPVAPRAAAVHAAPVPEVVPAPAMRVQAAPVDVQAVMAAPVVSVAAAVVAQATSAAPPARPAATAPTVMTRSAADVSAPAPSFATALPEAIAAPVPVADALPASIPIAAPVAAVAPAPASAVAPMAPPVMPLVSPSFHVAATAPLPAAPVAEIRLPTADTIAQASAQASAQLMAELQSLRSALQEQLSALSNTVTASDSARRHPAQTRLMTRLLTAGFSADVARRIALNAPAHADAAVADAWLQDVLAFNLKCAAAEETIIERGGAGGCNVYALVGPTGVGKTTTVAKLAARFAVKFGTAGLGLVTLDAYRVAAQEQLRTYGRILGTPVHLAQDGATLRELLSSMRSKRLVLIDTCGVGPRDERLPEMLAMLAQAGSGEQKVRPVLLLNAASHAETLDDTARAWRASEAAGTILTKLDEAARIGGALDCALRYKLTLLGLTNGQRVPEDLHLPNARLLAHLALKPANQLFALADTEGALVAQTARGAAHA